jgi:SAM-dependent methyltransferase
MPGQRVPRRLQWAVQLLDVAPDDRILEIGCGSGTALSLVCERLAGGQVTAIDRSATAIQRARRRNADHVTAGRAVLRQVDLVGLAPAGQRFDKAFAVNVNLFWARPTDAELLRLHQLLRPGGVLHLVYETPGGTDAGRVAAAAATLAAHGFATTVSAGPSPSLVCVTARPTGQRQPRSRRGP